MPPEHPYAHDIDLVGAGSLFQRIDTSRTEQGASQLVAWLGEPPIAADIVRQRQEAVRELAGMTDFREQLEVAARLATGSRRMSHTGFEELAALQIPVVDGPWFKWLVWLLPVLTAATYIGAELRYLSIGVPTALLVGHAAVLYFFARKDSRRAFDLLSAKQGIIESFEEMLLLIECTRFESPYLVEIQGLLATQEGSPSALLRRLRRWDLLMHLRSSDGQRSPSGAIVLMANLAFLLDLHLLRIVKEWTQVAKRRGGAWFRAVAEIEALSSLATFARCEPGLTYPEIVESECYLEDLGHPLIQREHRVVNSLRLAGPGHAMIVTGSNMAGKSTLLRSVGLNIALALAGAPVVARQMRQPLVRLRTTMRVNDSLQAHTSYFDAELQRIRLVIEAVEDKPPVFFLVDELLRGTNAQARSLGGCSILSHLLTRGAMGLAATHNVELTNLAELWPGRVENAHFTDVLLRGELSFDYKLRPGVVQTSNALHLIAKLGIEVPEDVDAVRKRRHA